MSQSLTRPEQSLPVLAAAVGAVLLADVVVVVAGMADLPLLFAAALVTAVALQRVFERTTPNVLVVERAVHLTPEAQNLVHTLALGILLATHLDDWGTATAAVVGVVLVGMPMTRAAVDLLRFGLKGRLAPPLETRNIDLGELERDTVLSADDTDRVARLLLDLSGAVLVVGALGVVADRLWPFLLFGVAYDLALVCLLAWMTFAGARTRTGLSSAEWERRVLERIRALHPEVILYFSGSPESTYQLNMWLDTMARLERPVLVLLRERTTLTDLAPTDLPVVCMPNAVSVMQAKLTTAKVALYVAHTSKNIHLLREPGMRHVFIGHGDSDKVSSINPFAKAYDELWVAGPAARDRWAEADVGVRPDAVVEVGRPQLGVVERGTRRGLEEPLTVLYAPTWEGWTDQDFGSSVVAMGPRLVRGLLEAGGVRVVYKPHPLTGIRDRKALRSHHEIVELLAATGALPVAADLADVEERLAASALRPEEHDALVAEWSRRFWADVSADQHLVVEGARPDLFDCFNHSDVLVADVSSVVSDFLASGKPYVCANPRGLPDDQFRRENPSTRAAYLLGPDCAELPDILRLVSGPDPLAAERWRLREYLLGPDEPPSIERWRAAVDRLVAASAGSGSAS